VSETPVDLLKRRRPAYRSTCVSIALLLSLTACGAPESETEAEVSEPPAVAEAEEPVQEAVQLVHFMPDRPERVQGTGPFNHAPHTQIDCATCHTVPEGHTTHAALRCGDCHKPVPPDPSIASTEDCARCHHSAERAQGCESCHGEPGVVESRQTLSLAVWDAPRERDLRFDHGLHTELQCGSCHQSQPMLTPIPCSSCHEDHHTPEARCAACHVPAAEGAHPPSVVHQGCSGTGCHDEPTIDAASATRPVCVACHQAQVDHEPGGVCIDCHKVRVASDAPVGEALPSWSRIDHGSFR